MAIDWSDPRVEFGALTILRGLASLFAALTFYIQARIPNPNIYVSGLAIACIAFQTLRIATSMSFDSLEQLTSNKAFCWTNVTMVSYISGVMHALGLGIAINLVLMVKNPKLFFRNSQRLLLPAVILPLLPTSGMVAWLYMDTKNNPLNPGVFAVRIDRCFFMEPKGAVWLGFMGVSFLCDFLIIVCAGRLSFLSPLTKKIFLTNSFSLKLVTTIIGLYKAFSQLQLSIQRSQDAEKGKLAAQSVVVPTKMFARLLILTLYSLAYSISSNYIITDRLHKPLPTGPISPEMKQDMTYKTEFSDWIGALDGFVIFIIFGTSSEAVKHFWKKIGFNNKVDKQDENILSSSSSSPKKFPNSPFNSPPSSSRKSSFKPTLTSISPPPAAVTRQEPEKPTSKREQMKGILKINTQLKK